ncbi:MAG: hypothetical protein IPO88_10195 [Nannocystis sp.]|uniref:hypothetical protein n=1 Tax=Nannocystis sp. TaxID=1962667 RepID=UPI002429592A|nr:hypothetical protein [Nannocystis sp.]MBK9753857.1 hypothetical protein [Nannocystis sp.]
MTFLQLCPPLARTMSGASFAALLLAACGDDSTGTTESSSTSSTGDSSDDTTGNQTTVTPTTDASTTDVPTTDTPSTSATGSSTDPGTTTSPDTTTGDTTTGNTTTGDTTTGDTTGGSTGGTAVCGDGVVDDGEVCDDGINDGAYNGCMPDCQAVGPFCGDAEVNGPETCDDGNDDNEDGCTTACAPASCGDGIIEMPEECDQDNLNGADCLSLGFTDGMLQCAVDQCTFDTSACVGCGDGLKQDNETCDGDDLGGEDCVSQGFAGGGTLLCALACDEFDTSQCIDAVCGNDTVEGDEVCDGNDLGGADCASVDPNVFAGGTLACNNSCDDFDSAGCSSGGCCDTGDPGICTVGPIEDCVCAQDPFCCEFFWDGICADEALGCGAICP